MENTLTSPSYPLPAVNGGSRRLALDNLIRRELKVGDPNDVAQIAQALLTRYRDDPRARAMAQEAQGLPSLPPSVPAAAVQQQAATGLDLNQAIADVEMDLRELISSNLSKDIVPELEGWAQSIRSAIQQGVSAAQSGMDMCNRDKAFAMRRQLGEYARLARMVGALTPAMNPNYRNLAQSLDEASSVILVLMGEALANTGFAGGRYLLQAPFSELQARRDAVLNALRNLTGATQQAFGQDVFPYGIHAYRRLFELLEDRGYGDLRSLLVENELARNMDDLVQLAGDGAASGLRALGATAWSQLDCFNRLIELCREADRPQSPALTSFAEALQTFIDGFEAGGGFRLLRVARPAVLFYGLYSSDGDSSGEIPLADMRLLRLVINRGSIAGQLDGLSFNLLNEHAIRRQIVGDMALYHLDRAIDLYCIGKLDLGIPEVRASAYSYVIDAAMSKGHINSSTKLHALFESTSNLLRPKNGLDPFWSINSSDYENWRKASGNTKPDPYWNASVLRQELEMQLQSDKKLQTIVGQMAQNSIPIDSVFGTRGCLAVVFAEAIGEIIKSAIDPRTGKLLGSEPPQIPKLSIPAPLAVSLDDIVFNGGEFEQ